MKKRYFSLRLLCLRAVGLCVLLCLPHTLS